MTDLSSLHRKAQQGIGGALDNSERVLVAQQGEYAALVATNRRALIFKGGSASGLMFGSQLYSWNLSEITGVELRKGMLNKSLVLQSVGAQPITKFGAFASGPESVWEAPNALFIPAGENDEKTVATLRRIVANQERVGTAASPTDDAADQIRKFAGLRDEGLISETEFQAKKQSILGVQSQESRSEPELERLGIDSAEYFGRDRRTAPGPNAEAKHVAEDAPHRASPQSNSGVSQGRPDEHQVDINSASVEQVVGLPGLDERVAQAIVAARERAGGFTSMEHLIENTDIQPHQIVAIRDRIWFGSFSAANRQRRNPGRILDV